MANPETSHCLLSSLDASSRSEGITNIRRGTASGQVAGGVLMEILGSKTNSRPWQTWHVPALQKIRSRTPYDGPDDLLFWQ